MTKAVFFDMNETLLDLSKLKKKFDKYFDDQYVMKYWFTKLLHTSTIVGSIGDYKNFGELAAAVLENVFYEAGKELTNDVKSEILGTFRNLDTYSDVPEALSILRDNNIKVIPVSNSSMEMMKEQLTNAGIIHLVDAYYSVDSVKKYKPFYDIYGYVAVNEALMEDEIYMVATHDWDLFGAKRVGLKTAYIERKTTIYNPFYDKADIYQRNLVDLVREIVEEV